jgi:hypothetical protein
MVMVGGSSYLNAVASEIGRIDKAPIMPFPKQSSKIHLPNAKIPYGGYNSFTVSRLCGR